jgi:hypothetical protein
VAGGSTVAFSLPDSTSSSSLYLRVSSRFSPFLARLLQKRFIGRSLSEVVFKMRPKLQRLSRFSWNLFLVPSSPTSNRRDRTSLGKIWLAMVSVRFGASFLKQIAMAYEDCYCSLSNPRHAVPAFSPCLLTSTSPRSSSKRFNHYEYMS